MHISNNGVHREGREPVTPQAAALPLTLFIHAVCEADPASLDDEDAQVAGLYWVDLNEAAAAGTTLAKRVSMALDVFHHNVPVGVLDHFRFDVVEYLGGPALEQDRAHETYSAAEAGSVGKAR